MYRRVEMDIGPIHYYSQSRKSSPPETILFTYLTEETPCLPGTILTPWRTHIRKVWINSNPLKVSSIDPLGSLDKGSQVESPHRGVKEFQFAREDYNKILESAFFASVRILRGVDTLVIRGNG